MEESIMLQLLSSASHSKEDLAEALRNSDELITKEIEELFVKRNFIRGILGELNKIDEDEEFFAELFEDE